MATVETTRSKIIPNAYVLLSNWRYLEHSLLRIIAGWGRCAGDWQDKLAVCYHVWQQAETVDRMRRRMDFFPGGKRDQAVSKAFETLVNAVLLAPSFADAMAGVHTLLSPALEAAYRWYAAAAHPVHDRPTVDLIHEVLTTKATQRKWYNSFCSRHPHIINRNYETKVRSLLAELGGLMRVIEFTAPFAEQCGVQTDFAMSVTPGRVKGWDRSPDIMPLLELNWSHSVEARRLFFMIGYAREMGVAEQQLRWIYYADFMPWDFVYAEARHMWDESRHGDSGYRRLRDFGFDFEHFGYDSYGTKGDGLLPAMSAADVYNAFYGVTQIAETGYFETKRYCLDDFIAGGDDASAEMMQFDIIDETSHVEYGRQWLTEMATRAGVTEDYRRRGNADRAKARRMSESRVDEYHRFLSGDLRTSASPDSPTAAAVHHIHVVPPNFQSLTDVPTKKHYDWMFEVIRDKCPLRNSQDAPLRPVLPM